MKQPKFPKSIKVLDIVAEELHLPTDASLSDILTTLYLIDEDGEVMKWVKKVIVGELCDKILESTK
jgi:hypothetical protein